MRVEKFILKIMVSNRIPCLPKKKGGGWAVGQGMGLLKKLILAL